MFVENLFCSYPLFKRMVLTMEKSNTNHSKWYLSWWFIILLLVLRVTAPIAIILMWGGNRFNLVIRGVLTFAAVISFFSFIAGFRNTPEITSGGISSTQPPPKETVYTTASTLNLRHGANKTSSAIGKLARGTRVTVKRRQGNWILVRLKDGKEGWIHKGYVGSLEDVRKAEEAARLRASKMMETSISSKAKTGEDREPVEIQPRAYKILTERDASMKALGNRRLSSYTHDEIRRLPLMVRKTYEVIVPSDITKGELKATLKKVITDRSEANPDIDSITIIAYDREADASWPYTYGRAVWAPGGKYENITAQIAASNDRRSYTITYDIMEKVGLPATERPTVREFEISDAYTRMMEDPNAPGNQPTPSGLKGERVLRWVKKHNEEVWKYKGKVEKRIAKKYGISVEEVHKIVHTVFRWQVK